MDISEDNDQQTAAQTYIGPSVFQAGNQQFPSDIAEERPNPDFDIDSLLLQKFSCLGTTDHDDLIKQFQIIMNNQINSETSRFFLEMSNWNLQTAVCCYFDFCNNQTLPVMKIVNYPKQNEDKQVWKVQNSGTDAWPTGCYLMSPNQTNRLDLPALKAGETCDIMANIPPSTPAIMWRLCTPNGAFFGDTIWMIPYGSPDTASDLAHRMSHLYTSPSPTSNPSDNIPMSAESYPQLDVQIETNCIMMD